MGIPSPIWSWTNDIIAIKAKLNIQANEFDASLNQLALEIYNQGYDIRFQTAQVIPVFVKELLVRMIYATRRLLQYFSVTDTESRAFPLLWKSCEPFSNATVKRMLTVAHDSAWKSQFFSGLMMPLMSFIGNFGYVVVCVLGAVLAQNGTISFGVIVSFMIYIRLFTQPLSQLAQVFTGLQAALAAS